MPAILAPSILAANYAHLQQDVEQSIKGGAQWIHCDIMDGHFVPNISYGPMIVDTVNKFSDVFLDVHLMIYNVDQYIPEFVKVGADLISVHIEAVPHIHRSVQLIKSFGIQSGVAVNPGTSLTQLEAILPDVDLVVVMSVNPGFGGQKFIESTYERVKWLDEFRKKHGLAFKIEIDGGVGLQNAKQLVTVGADVLVAGSSVYGAPNIELRASELLALANS
ncbi:ribulose-phosphate 3-epimerase [bacterium]|nr:MAG: ribulose-phosphate 3-epimerase [bacterium]